MTTTWTCICEHENLGRVAFCQKCNTFWQTANYLTHDPEPTDFIPGRFLLLQCGEIYLTSWDTWEECEVAFPIGDDDPEHADDVLLDQATGRRWDRFSKYDWEAAAT